MAVGDVLFTKYVYLVRDDNKLMICSFKFKYSWIKWRE